MTDKTLRRREFLEKLIVRGLLVGATAVSQTHLFAAWEEAQVKARKPTPPEVLGPFYKKGAPNQANLRLPREPGLPLRISGRILDTRGEPVHGARVDLWHADDKGIYDVQGYRYRAKLALDDATDYSVETIMPGHYPSRPVQHVHYLITAPGCEPLITQLYFATDPFFEGDPDKNYKKGGHVTNWECVRPVSLLDENTSPRSAVIFDIILKKA
jgi:protocatechuate 3,4-dioxygenase beta subunit